jgi:hypothetical protein
MDFIVMKRLRSMIKVASYSIEQGETTYFVPTTKFAKGMYQFSLLQNGEVKEMEKLVID